MDDIQRFVLIPYTMWETNNQQPHQQQQLYQPTPLLQSFAAPNTAGSSSSLTILSRPASPSPPALPPQPPPHSSTTPTAPQSYPQAPPPPPLSLKTPNLKLLFESQLKKDHNAKKILDELFRAENIDFSTTNTIIVDRVDSKLDVIDFIRTLRRKNNPIDDRHLLVLDQLKLNPHLVINENALDRESGEWIPFSF